MRGLLSRMGLMTKRRRKNYWVAMIITVWWWVILGAIVLLVDPEVLADYPLPGTYGLFFLFLFLGVWFLTSLLLINTRRGLLVGIGAVVLGYLKLWGLLSLINAGLLIGALVAFEIYYHEGKKGKMGRDSIDKKSDDGL